MRYRLRLKSLGELETLKENLNDPRGVMTSVGALHKSLMSERFEKQGKNRNEWAPRMVPNVPGIISDLRTSTKPKGRRFVERPAAVDTGRMRNGIDFDVVGARRVLTGSGEEYAATQHDGGESESETISEKMQKNLWRFLKSSKGSQWKNDLGWLLNKKYRGETITINVRARPWADFGEDELRETDSLLVEALGSPGGDA